MAVVSPNTAIILVQIILLCLEETRIWVEFNVTLNALTMYQIPGLGLETKKHFWIWNVICTMYFKNIKARHSYNWTSGKNPIAVTLSSTILNWIPVLKN